MVTTNILTLFYSKILYFTFYVQTYKFCITIITKIKSKIQPKMHYKIHIYTIVVSVLVFLFLAICRQNATTKKVLQYGLCLF
jgi:hypothetical protein